MVTKTNSGSWHAQEASAPQFFSSSRRFVQAALGPSWHILVLFYFMTRPSEGISASLWANWVAERHLCALPFIALWVILPHGVFLGYFWGAFLEPKNNQKKRIWTPKRRLQMIKNTICVLIEASWASNCHCSFLQPFPSEMPIFSLHGAPKTCFVDVPRPLASLFSNLCFGVVFALILAPCVGRFCL